MTREKRVGSLQENRLYDVSMKFGLGKHNFIVRIKSDQIMFSVVLHATSATILLKIIKQKKTRD